MTSEDKDATQHADVKEPTVLKFSEQLKLTKCTLKECGCGFNVHCPFCDKDHFKPGSAMKVRDHLEFRHFAYAVQFDDYFIVKCFRICDNKPSGHYHCPVCRSMILKRVAFVKHLESHAKIMGKPDGFVIALDSKHPNTFSVEGHEINLCNKDCAETSAKHYHCPKCKFKVDDRSLMVTHIWRCDEVIGTNQGLKRFNVEKDEEFITNSELIHPREAKSEVRCWHQSIVRNMKDLQIEKCTLENCCDGKLHCPLCTKDRFKPTFHSHLLGHFVAHWKKRISYKDYSILICTQSCELLHKNVKSIKYHYHCPICGETRRRRPNFIHHLKICQGERYLTHRYSILRMDKDYTGDPSSDMINSTGMDTVVKMETSFNCDVNDNNGNTELTQTNNGANNTDDGLEDVNQDITLPINKAENSSDNLDVTQSGEDTNGTSVLSDSNDISRISSLDERISADHYTLETVLQDVCSKTDTIISSSPGTVQPVYTVSGQPENLLRVKELLKKTIAGEMDESAKMDVPEESEIHKDNDSEMNGNNVQAVDGNTENASVRVNPTPKKGRGRPRKNQEQKNDCITEKKEIKENQNGNEDLIRKSPRFKKNDNITKEKDEKQYRDGSENRHSENEEQCDHQSDANTVRLSRRYLDRKTRVDFSALVQGKRKFKDVSESNLSLGKKKKNDVPSSNPSVKNGYSRSKKSNMYLIKDAKSKNCHVIVKEISSKQSQTDTLDDDDGDDDDYDDDDESVESLSSGEGENDLPVRHSPVKKIAHVPEVYIESLAQKSSSLSKFNLSRKHFYSNQHKTSTVKTDNIDTAEVYSSIDNSSENGCKLCDFRGEDYSDLTLHYTEMHEDFEQIRCDVCERFFDRSAGLTRHLLTVHGPKEAPQDFMCTECNKVFGSEKSLSLHFTTIHGGKQVKDVFSCRVCDFKTKAKIDLKNHFDTNHRDIPVCEICGKKFARQQHLYTHMQAVHYKNKKAVCDLCGKNFDHVRYLKSHMKRHYGIKDHVCKQCGVSFTESNTLRLHMETHLLPEDRHYKFVCSFCGKKYLSKSNYKDHLNKHTGDKPYKCDICDKRFGFKSMIDKHKMFVHSSDKPFKCSNCPKAFKLKRLLDQHMVTHTGQSSYICNTCKRPFSCKNTLKTHITKCKHNSWSRKVNSPRTVLLYTDNFVYNPQNEPGIVLNVGQLDSSAQSESLAIVSPAEQKQSIVPPVEQSLSVEPEIVMTTDTVVMGTDNVMATENIILGTENIVIDAGNSQAETSLDTAVFLCSECNAVFEDFSVAEEHILMNHTETTETFIPSISADGSIEQTQAVDVITAAAVVQEGETP